MRELFQVLVGHIAHGEGQKVALAAPLPPVVGRSSPNISFARSPNDVSPFNDQTNTVPTRDRTSKLAKPSPNFCVHRRLELSAAGCDGRSFNFSGGGGATLRGSSPALPALGLRRPRGSCGGGVSEAHSRRSSTRGAG